MDLSARLFEVNAVVRKSHIALAVMIALGSTARAEPPADIDACIKLSAETARAANVKTEKEYVKFHSMLLDLDSACGTRDYVAAEKKSAEIKAAFPAK